MSVPGQLLVADELPVDGLRRRSEELKQRRVCISTSIKGIKKGKSLLKLDLVNVRIMIWIVNDLLNNRDYLPIL